MTAAKIQIAPPLPSSVIFGIRKSRTGPLSALGMSPSFFTDVLPFSFKNIWGNLLEISIKEEFVWQKKHFIRHWGISAAETMAEAGVIRSFPWITVSSEWIRRR